MTNEAVGIVILDYHSPDGLEKYINDNYSKYLASGRLKYFKLVTELDGFDMAMAKHVVHLLSDADVLFNLDADNFIGTTIPELQSLEYGQVLVSRKTLDTGTARGGRIGVHREDYLRLGGYDKRILGVAGDDGRFVEQAQIRKMRLIWSKDTSIPIPQDVDYKQINVVKREPGFKLPSAVVVKNHLGEERLVKLNLAGTPR